MSQTNTQKGMFYHPRIPELSPFYRMVEKCFHLFEQVYPRRYEMRFGFWRPIIRRAVDKFLKCGDHRHGFARVHCTKFGGEFFVAFSCKQRGCCHSPALSLSKGVTKRVPILGHRIIDDVMAEFPHRQRVITIHKRLRVYFRLTRSLLGDLCRLAYETVCEFRQLEIDDEGCLPAMVGAIQTFGNLSHWHSHVQGIVAEGVFTPDGKFVAAPYPGLQRQRAE